MSSATRWASIAAILAIGLVALGAFTLARPARHYDADNGVMCYTIPGDISCVRTD